MLNVSAMLPNESVRLAWIELGCPEDPSVVARLIGLSGKIEKFRELSSNRTRLKRHKATRPQTA